MILDEAFLGMDAELPMRLMDRNGDPYTPPEGSTLTATVWRGDDEEELYAPIVEWDGGTDIVIVIAKEQLAGNGVGRFYLRVICHSTTRDFPVLDGVLPVRNGPGEGHEGIRFTTDDDLMQIDDSLEGIQDDSTDKAGYRDYQSLAAMMMISRWVDSYCPIPGFIRRKTAWSSIWGFYRPDPTLSPPTSEDLKAWLLDERLVITPQISQAAAKWAVSMILRRQAVNAPRSGYADRADLFRAQAEIMTRAAILRIDTAEPADGVPDFEYENGALTWLTPQS